MWSASAVYRNQGRTAASEANFNETSRPYGIVSAAGGTLIRTGVP